MARDNRRQCHRCGEWYDVDDIGDALEFSRYGCGVSLGTVCDGGSDALVAAYDRIANGR